MFLISRLSTQVTFKEREKYWSLPFLAFFVITTFIYAVFAIVTVNMVSLDCMNGKERSQCGQHHPDQLFLYIASLLAPTHLVNLLDAIDQHPAQVSIFVRL